MYLPLCSILLKSRIMPIHYGGSSHVPTYPELTQMASNNTSINDFFVDAHLYDAWSSNPSTETVEHKLDTWYTSGIDSKNSRCSFSKWNLDFCKYQQFGPNGDAAYSKLLSNQFFLLIGVSCACVCVMWTCIADCETWRSVRQACQSAVCIAHLCVLLTVFTKHCKAVCVKNQESELSIRRKWKMRITLQ